MKQFCCGDVVPGCTARFRGASDQEILTAVAEHAQRDHGMTEIPASVVTLVQANIQEVPSN
jgi:predicted small metal-binding protein